VSGVRAGLLARLKRARPGERIIALGFVAIFTIGVTLVLDGLMMKAEAPALHPGPASGVSPPPAPPQ
jgi:hypothetical protein